MTTRKVRGVARCFLGFGAREEARKVKGALRGTTVSWSCSLVVSKACGQVKTYPQCAGRGGAFSCCLPLVSPRLVSRPVKKQSQINGCKREADYMYFSFTPKLHIIQNKKRKSRNFFSSNGFRRTTNPSSACRLTQTCGGDMQAQARIRYMYLQIIDEQYN